MSTPEEKHGELDWDGMLLALADSTQRKIVTRSEIAGAGVAPWFASTVKCEVQAKHYTGTGEAHDWLSGKDSYDVWWAWNWNDSNGANQSCVIAVNMDWSKWGNATDGVLSKYTHQPSEILVPLSSGSQANDTVSLWSFLDGADAFKGLKDKVAGWRTTVADWAADIDSPGSSWQGSAAGEFKVLLEGFAGELESIGIQLEIPDYATDLRAAGTSITPAVFGLGQVYRDWFDGQYAWPAAATFKAMREVLKDCQPVLNTVDDTVTVTTVLGDPHSEAFFDALQARAKAIWLKDVHEQLDLKASTYFATVKAAYDKLHTDFGMPFIPVSIRTPTVEKPDTSTVDPPKVDPKTGLPDTKIPDGTGGTGGGGTGGGGSGSVKTPGPVNLGTGGGGSGTGGGGSGLPSSITGGGGGSGTGTGTPVLDKNGKPVLGADNKPVLLPPGGYIGAGGQLYDANGKPVTKDGKPVVVPEGSTVAPTSGGSLYGGTAKVPKGSTVREDGTVVDKDGKAVLDVNGNPVVLGKGDTIAADGTLLDPSGKPISNLNQQLTNQEHVLATSTPVSRTVTGSSGGDYSYQGTSSTGSSSYGLLGGYGTGYSGSTGTPGSSTGSGGITPLGGGSGARLVSSGGGLGAKAVENSGPAVAKMAAAEAAAQKTALQRAASATAAEEAQMMGRSVSTSGGSGAPMMPMGGAGGGAGGQGDKDRQRTTWLSEDEEVWGTDTGTVSGVIGR
ncbi:hypothetical protein [Kitasatospora sp. NPDC057223]|uniref:hypothetical protein n=1 Tax=Kitasatospora sp. NPDC057223 TaxID=3346055 RepID=UPI0036281254